MKNTKSKKTTGNVTETLRKIISAGSPSDISKELISTAMGQANKTKDEISAKVTSEVISWIKKIDFGKEFTKIAQEHKFKITAEVEILKKNK